MKYLVNSTYYYLIIFLFLFQSCQKDGDATSSSTQTEVKIANIALEFEDDENSNPTPSGAKATKLKEGLEKSLVSFSKGKTIEVSLYNTAVPIEDDEILSPTLQEQKSATLVQKTLNKNVLYKLLIYDDAGKYITEQIYAYGQESTTAGIKLNSGKKYTFIAYSVNSSTDLPHISNPAQLSTAKLEAIDTDLLFYKKEMTLAMGTTNLNVILKHQFSQITTILKIDPNSSGTFTTLSQAFMQPARNSASLQFSDQTVTYQDIKTNGNAVTFPSLGAMGLRTVTSLPTLMINPNTSTGKLSLGQITLDGDTKNNVVISNIKIKPGVKYNLVLNFKTCTQDVSTNTDLNWDYAETFGRNANGIRVSGITKNGRFIPSGEILTQTIQAPGADYGFVFDITRMDNSFNMKLNNISLAKQEIQFETGISLAQNIRFKDGSIYSGINRQGGTIPQVFDMTGTAANPLIKVVISKTGQVTMFGSKTSGGPLYELELFNGNQFNTFTWNSGSNDNNEVIITQLVAGRTVIKGVGTGKKKIICPF